MAVVKDHPRPLARDRPSFSSSLPRQGLSRTRTQSATYDKTRISRRRGSNMTPAALSSVLQAASEQQSSDGKVAIGSGGSSRSAQARMALGTLNTGVYPTPNGGRDYGLSSSAIVEGPPMSALSDKVGSFKSRRASDSLQKADGKRRGTVELKCEQCGKHYKHSSCLTKHLWEHTPEWGLTSKLLISKHQQVQLLEAASVLLAMNQDGSDGAVGVSGSDNDDSSSREQASGLSDNENAISSGGEESPPPLDSRLNVLRKQHSPTSSAGYDNSYQSVFSSVEGPTVGVTTSSLGLGAYHGSYSGQTDATSYNDGVSGEDQADLAAAVGLLSCSYGTTAARSLSRSLAGKAPAVSTMPQPYQSAERHLANVPDVQMVEASIERDTRPAAPKRTEPNSDEDEGVFGTMEE